MTVYNVAIIGLGIMGRRMLTAMTAHDRFHVGGAWAPTAGAIRRRHGGRPAGDGGR